MNMESKYVAPEVEVIEIAVEKGFAASPVEFDEYPGYWD
jgi:hypothetical protein